MARLKTGPQTIDPDRLHVSPLNDQTREISPEAADRLRHAMRNAPAHLDARPIIVDVDGAIIAGRHRYETAVELLAEKERTPFRRRFKDGTLPVYVHRFTDDTERVEWLTRDNADFASWVEVEIAGVLAAHQKAGGDAALLGFPQADLEGLLALAGEPDFSPADPDSGARLDHRLTRNVTCPECGHEFEIAKQKDE